MARWKSRAELLLSGIELLFLSLTVEALQGKTCQNSLPSGVGRSLGAKISGVRGRSWEYFLVSTKLDTFCYPTVQTAPCYVPSFDTIYVKKLISLKHCVRSQITRLKLQKSFCDLEHGASL